MAWSFGKRLHHARIERGFSQRTLAQQAGLRQSHVSMLEHAHHYPNAGVIRRLVHALSIDPNYLFGFKNEIVFVEYGDLEPEDECAGART